MNLYPVHSAETRLPARFGAALLKVASRCNLNCDYCYVYNHVDQSWRNQPKLMAEQTAYQFGLRLDEYVAEFGLDRFSIIFHGGEPLLYTADGLVRLAAQLRHLVRTSCHLDFSLQTNGVLLTDLALGSLAEAGILISLSLDGPRHIHDRHRLNHREESTFEMTMKALGLLSAAGSNVFSGVIAVIDPASSPSELFDFFAPMELPRLDLLLPDATHAVPPPGRIDDQGCYRRWLEDAFDLWFSKYSNLPIRWFDAILASRLGVPSPTDVMGFGSVSLVVIETDGSYTDHDVFKIVGNREAYLEGHSVFTTAFKDIAEHPRLLEHGYRLTFDGLASECKTCPVVEACGGGCVMHRAHPARGLDSPTVYCREMFGLMATATQALRTSLIATTTDVVEKFTGRGPNLVERCRRWRGITETLAEAKAQSMNISRGAASAAAILLATDARKAETDWTLAGVRGSSAMWLGSIQIQSCDLRLVEPFRNTIRLLRPGSDEVRYAIDSLHAIEAFLRIFDPELPVALSQLISDIIFVESTMPEEGGIFSFSDDEAPNVLYIAPYAGGRPISPEDLADSIYHEFLHQVLHHFEREGAVLFDRVYPRFPAPWRPGLRPSGGFLHGTFVFAGLSRYWGALAGANSLGLDFVKAERNAARTARQAEYGIQCLREFALLTPRGFGVIDALAAELNMPGDRIESPGVL